MREPRACERTNQRPWDVMSTRERARSRRHVFALVILLVDVHASVVDVVDSVQKPRGYPITFAPSGVEQQRGFLCRPMLSTGDAAPIVAVAKSLQTAPQKAVMFAEPSAARKAIASERPPQSARLLDLICRKSGLPVQG